MSKAKRRFIKAGSILAIIVAVFTIIGCVSVSIIKNYISEEVVIEILKTDEDFEYVSLPEEDYEIIYNDDEYKLTIPSDNVKTIVKIVQNISTSSLVMTSVYAIVSFVLAIIMLVQVKNNKCNKPITIAQLILSLILNNTLTFAFMIVVLCLRDKPITLENINEIVIDKE